LVGLGRASAEVGFSAVIDAEGNLVRGIQVQASTRNGLGDYQVTFEQDIEACTFLAGIEGALGGQTSVQAVNTKTVQILTLNKNGEQADSTFNLIASCLPGELVINEVMANPAGPSGSEAQREWFELFNATANAVSLSGLTVGTASTSQAITCGATVPPHRYALFARSADSAVNGHLPPVDCVFSLNLPNSGGRLTIKRGTVVIDTVNFTGTTWLDGSSLSLTPKAQNTIDNDDLANWCAVLRGTPTLANPNC
jgi:hypothetical protein